MTKNIIYILVAGVAVYFLFFYKKDKTTTPTTPTGGSTGGSTGGNTGTTTAPPYAIGETRLKLKTGCSSYYVDPPNNKDYTNTDLAPVFLGGKVVRRGTQQGVNGYVLQFNTSNGIEERGFYETDLII